MEPSASSQMLRGSRPCPADSIATRIIRTYANAGFGFRWGQWAICEGGGHRGFRLYYISS